MSADKSAVEKLAEDWNASPHGDSWWPEQPYGEDLRAAIEKDRAAGLLRTPVAVMGQGVQEWRESAKAWRDRAHKAETKVDHWKRVADQRGRDLDKALNDSLQALEQDLLARQRAEAAKAEIERLTEERDDWHQFYSEAKAKLATARADALNEVRSGLVGHPKCDVHPDDDAITCGWKRVVASVQYILDRELEDES